MSAELGSATCAGNAMRVGNATSVGSATCAGDAMRVGNATSVGSATCAGDAMRIGNATSVGGTMSAKREVDMYHEEDEASINSEEEDAKMVAAWTDQDREDREFFIRKQGIPTPNIFVSGRIGTIYNRWTKAHPEIKSKKQLTKFFRRAHVS